MKNNQTAEYNTELRNKPALEIVRWGIARANGRAMVSTNFRPFEAVVLHLCTQVQPDIPVLWVDHGYNRSATYLYAEKLRDMLHLNLKIYLPKLTTAHRDAIYGPIPSFDDETELKKFSAMMKLEPFQHGMKELAPTVWFTALRKVQNPGRAKLDHLAEDKSYGTIKISPVFYWTDADMEAYLEQHNLPNEWDYFDPTKADEKRECGIHVI
ncbi:phosphoadenosine phosphosulfate reductase [Nitrosomonas aestuarii]|uniref:Phosphoadenosine phosphosulfate reductase n=1 Tax=Nitrosomonas aestuarii TaxID=52441 RepID=A0A1I4EAS7_9PROT|nr:phosphoadenosine phosphosulfate reductase family protein [Nitrosomonas aestuarii]SFL02888.1 phosphoadenosine phosphosulfate reductase [Nitrosomonas aestuarii]